MASHGVPRAASTVTRSEKTREKELQTIKEYRGLVDQLQQKVDDGEYTPLVLNLTSQILKLNPEYYTVWNHRRRILLYGLFPPSDADPDSADDAAAREQILSLVRSDLNFLLPLLVQYPKCYWIWNHRIWLLNQSLVRLNPSTSRTLWLEELALVSKMLVRDSRNFHGWGYRRHVVQNLHSLFAFDINSDPSPPPWVESEMRYTTRMISTNLSNFSAWHQRSIVAPRLLEERHAGPAERRKFLDEEFETAITALYTDPFNQSVWVYHGWLMANVMPAACARTPSVATYTEDERLRKCKEQLEQLKELLELEAGCTYIYSALLRYSADIYDGSEGMREEIRGWLEALRRLDPLRSGRWREMEAKIF